jgi:hypothetical protein
MKGTGLRTEMSNAQEILAIHQPNLQVATCRAPALKTRTSARSEMEVTLMKVPSIVCGRVNL